MLKKISFVFLVIFIMAIITGCGASVTDVWDGSVAAFFAKGNGSSEKPYEISTGAELAYLAAQVNAGNPYENTHFVLKNDIDLNSLEWTPIGNGINSFSGTFDGGEHTLKNLSISGMTPFTQDQDTISFECGVAGLFGSCNNAVMQNLNIDGARITILSSIPKINYMGIAAGYFAANTESGISNIRVSDAQITLPKDIPLNMRDITAGGMIGEIKISEGGAAALQCVSAEVIIDIDYDNPNALHPALSEYLGGVIGIVQNGGSFRLENFKSEMKLYLPKEIGSHYAGAVGFLDADGIQSVLKNGVSNVFVDEKNCINDDYITIQAVRTHCYAVLGSCAPFPARDKSRDLNLTCENLFGCVYPLGDEAGFLEPNNQLYRFRDGVIYTEINCQGCESLPDGHGLDPEIWNLDNLSDPKLK